MLREIRGCQADSYCGRAKESSSGQLCFRAYTTRRSPKVGSVYDSGVAPYVEIVDRFRR
jgi:hypothetical protein